MPKAVCVLSCSGSSAFRADREDVSNEALVSAPQDGAARGVLHVARSRADCGDVAGSSRVPLLRLICVHSRSRGCIKRGACFNAPAEPHIVSLHLAWRVYIKQTHQLFSIITGKGRRTNEYGLITNGCADEPQTKHPMRFHIKVPLLLKNIPMTKRVHLPRCELFTLRESPPAHPKTATFAKRIEYRD